jgi:uncharacterized protein YbjT (DUF2867 family)
VHVLIIGATSGTGRLLVDELQQAGHEVRALVRDPDKGAALAEQGVEVVPGDLIDPDPTAIVDATTGVDAVAFCAGSGSKTGKDQTLMVDLHGAVRTIDAAVAAGAGRYVMLSSMAADDPWKTGSEKMAPYFAAKHAADRILAASDLDWTIVRPGGLTHDEGTGEVTVGQPTIPEDQRGERQIPRADVAATMAACLLAPSAVGATFELLSGTTPIADAVGQLHPMGPVGPSTG